MSDEPAWLDRIAHDLRGPLMPLQTASYLLRNGGLDADRQAELVDVIDRQTRQLARMIDELGDWLRAGQQRLIGHREPCDMALLLDTAAVGAGVQAPPVEDRSGGAQVDGDPQRLVQLLRILLSFSNALCHGAAPTVTLGRADGRLRMEWEIAGAAGAGSVDDLFTRPQHDPFDGGLGLQLLLARAIAQAHGGELEAMAAGEVLRLRCELPLAEG
ncbi:MAG TPA: histidine kinase dimerization/phospho-acceptor domain-containing protein [Xanthomonadaceae bacterium]|nr:histidine kinase dimerization/phospho-acceptor domain-containing protein [Xanthomonadaceae bacterium]